MYGVVFLGACKTFFNRTRMTRIEQIYADFKDGLNQNLLVIDSIRAIRPIRVIRVPLPLILLLQSLYHRDDLFISVTIQFHRFRRAGGLAGAAAAADAGVDEGDRLDQVPLAVSYLFFLHGAVGADLFAGEAADTAGLSDPGDDRFPLQFVFGEEGHDLGGGGGGLGDCFRDVFGPLAGAGQVDAGGGAFHRAQFGVGLGVEVVFVVGDAEFLGQGVGPFLGLDRGGEDDHVGFDLDLDADGDVAPHDDDLVPFLVEAGNHAPDVDRFFLFDRSAPEFVVAFAGGAGVHEEDVGLAVMDFVMVEHRVFGGVHAPDLGAVGDPFFPRSRSDALDEDYLFGFLAVGGTQDLAAGRSG